MSLKDKRLFLLDMDGTIYIGDKLFEGSRELLQQIRDNGGRYVFLTNNSSRGTDSYIEKLARLGIEACAGDFLTSADAAIDYIKENYPPEDVYYVFGTKSLIRQLDAAGIKTASEPSENVSAVLLGYDTELTYKKLEDCCILLGRGVRYIATHPDMVCPTPYGSAPDCGSVIEMLFTATGRRPVVIGKPKPQMALTAMKKYGYTKDQTCLMGDRIYTDIACGVNAGIETIFVLSGEGVLSDTDKYGIHPTYVFDSAADVLEEIRP